MGEPPAKLCRLALGRLLAPFGLSDPSDYEAYLKRIGVGAGLN